MKNPFPKSLRITKRSQFLLFKSSGSHYVGSFVIIEVLENQLDTTRLGITVTKKYGDAHERNRFKRIVREAFRLTYPDLPKGLDLLIKPRTLAKKAMMQDIQYELKKFLIKT